MSSDSQKLFMVLYDDQQGYCCPMAWDERCDGAVRCCIGEPQRVALFASRAAAREAINISAKWAALNRAQGNPVDMEFVDRSRKYLQVLQCQLRK